MEAACGAIGATIGFGAGMFGGGATAIVASTVFPPAAGVVPHSMTVGAGAGGAAGAKMGIKIGRALSGLPSRDLDLDSEELDELKRRIAELL
jgi:hypothetical protein